MNVNALNPDDLAINASILPSRAQAELINAYADMLAAREVLHNAIRAESVAYSHRVYTYEQFQMALEWYTEQQLGRDGYIPTREEMVAAFEHSNAMYGEFIAANEALKYARELNSDADMLCDDASARYDVAVRRVEQMLHSTTYQQIEMYDTLPSPIYINDPTQIRAAIDALLGFLSVDPDLRFAVYYQDRCPSGIFTDSGVSTRESDIHKGHPHTLMLLRSTAMLLHSVPNTNWNMEEHRIPTDRELRLADLEDERVRRAAGLPLREQEMALYAILSGLLNPGQ